MVAASHATKAAKGMRHYNNTTEGADMKATKYVCECGKDNSKSVKAMIRAGFEPRHLACKGCGRHEIRTK